MASESNDRSEQIRATVRRFLGHMRVDARWRDDAAEALADLLLFVDARPDVATGERDERTADLEALTGERDVARAETERYKMALAKSIDERDGEARLRLVALRELKHATDELEKTRALVDELRAQLAAPTVQSAAVKAWLETRAAVRSCITGEIRRNAAVGSLIHVDHGARAAADVLDSLSMRAPCAECNGSGEVNGMNYDGVMVPCDKCDERAGAPTDAAEEVARLRTERDSLRSCNERQRLTIEDLYKRLATIASTARIVQ